MNTDDQDYQRHRDELIRAFAMLDAIRTGRSTSATDELHTSRLAILSGNAPPPSKPRFRVIEGGKGKP